MTNFVNSFFEHAAGEETAGAFTFCLQTPCGDNGGVAWVSCLTEHIVHARNVDVRC